MASEIFGNPSFTRFWTARSASGFAYHMTAVAVGWQVYAMTGSAFMLGLVGLTEFLPQFLLTLVVLPALYVSWFGGRDAAPGEEPKAA